MKTKLALYVACLVFFWNSCTQQKTELPKTIDTASPFNLSHLDKSYYQIPLDSSIILGRIAWHQFSPIKKNRLWVVTYAQPFEINLDSLTVYPLDSVIPYNFPTNFRREHVVVSPMDSMLWFTGKGRELVQYDYATGMMKKTPMRNFLSTSYVSGNNILLGLSQGLYYYDRRIDSIRLHKPTEHLWIRSIVPSRTGYLINNQYRVDLLTDTLEHIIDPTGHVQRDTFSKNQFATLLYEPRTQSASVIEKGSIWSVTDKRLKPQNISLQDSIVWFKNSRHIGRYNVRSKKTKYYPLERHHGYKVGHIIFDQAHHWLIYGDRVLLFDKNTEQYYDVLQRDASSITMFLSLGDYLLFIGQNKIELFKKEPLILKKTKHESPRQKAQTIQDQVKKLYALQKTTIDSLVRIHELYDSLLSGKKLEEYEKAIVRDLRNQIVHRVLTDTMYQKKVLPYINNNNTSIAHDIKEALIQVYAKKGLVYKCVDIYERYRSDTIEISENIARNIPFVLKAKKSLDSLKYIRPTEEEELWAKGQILSKMLQFDWSLGKYYRNMELSHAYYRQLLEKFPNSIYSDQVEWILNKECGEQDPCGDYIGYQNCIDYYQSFIQRYPKSQHVPDALRAISEHYFHLPVEHHEKQWVIYRAITFLEKIKEIDPHYYEHHNIKGEISNYYQIHGQYGWDIKAVALKEQYRVDEPIVIRFTIGPKSTSAKSRELRLYDTSYYSNVAIRNISMNGKSINAQDIFRIQDVHSEPSYYEIVLRPGEVYTETVTLNKSARGILRKMGKYYFAPGSYKLNVGWDSFGQIYANDIVEFVVQ